MGIEILTKQDLVNFKQELLTAFAEILRGSSSEPEKEFLRSKEARKMLGGISNGTLQNLRVSGLLKPSKIGGVFYYKRSEIIMLLHAEPKL